ncbi:uncharacterized protein LTR77_006625 [Saxophila tyrrhenica]|uniref:Zn(2)-C6 fungal-type domain-containing protein n=1 Tax=Saxophila tyrrhenica TaxID=1690608 RepID=A0AAV9P7C8_9PEZI|nr:hypothetical protein LTR77_006625 [Saxophila tyrrhenica]
MESIAQIASLANNEINDDGLSPGQHNNNSNKRKAEDGGQQQRAKRNRYISIACNECKRRKIKCNGQTPCQRCGNLSLDCVYTPNCCNGFKDSQEFKEMSAHIASLQEQVNSLYQDMTTLRGQISIGGPTLQHAQSSSAIDPSLQSPFRPHRPSFTASQASPGAPLANMSPSIGLHKSHSQNSQPTFRGPTSNDFNFGVARNSLQTMGITSHNDLAENGSGEAGNATREASPEQSATARDRDRMQYSHQMHSTKDPIWAVSREEALRLCRVWEDEMGIMYPVLDMDKVIAHTQHLYRFMEAAHRTGLMQQGFPGADAIDDEDTNILKLILATALTAEGSGKSELGQRIFDYVHPAIETLLLGNVGIKGIRLLVLTAMYEFQIDNEGTAWRITGMTARLCIELGLHRRETYEAMTDESERSETGLLFWAIYVLDRRWSFGTGMPFALQDQDIDPLLPKPDDRSPYLSAMIQYSAIGAKVWRTVAAAKSPGSGGPVDTEEMGYLDYQVIQWHRNIPLHLRFEHPSRAGRLSTPIEPPPSRAAGRLRVLLYIRANQMRILIYRQVLHSATSIMQYREQAQTVVDVAKDTIRVLTHINQTTDLYRTHQVLFNAFLTSALAVLFLAVAHTPAEFAENVREEFYMALDLVRGFSKNSWVSKRLWKTVRVLKDLGPKLGLASGGNDSSSHDPPKHELDPNRSAAVAMAGLAGHNVDELALYQTRSNSGNAQLWSSGATGASSSPEHMANDLTSLFEAAGGYHALDNGNANGGSAGSFSGTGEGGTADGMDNLTALFGGDEGLSNILKELF